MTVSERVPQRVRRIECGPAPLCRIHALRGAAGKSLGAVRVRAVGKTGLWRVSVRREHRAYIRVHAHSTRCILHAAPPPRSKVAPAVRKSMKGNKGKDTKPELVVRQRLREAGLTGYRLQWKVPGRPDVAYPGKKVCIFVNGCFWHRCPHCHPSMPKTNLEYWVPKFQRNVERDERNVRTLEEQGWRVHVIWECQLKKKTVDETFDRLIPLLKEELGRA